MNGPKPAAVSDPERDRLGSIALDQWRGLALVLVLVSHGFFFTNRVNGIGRVGVNLFFFISGILVFRTLSRSRAANAWERTWSFWWRRFRRLYPALIAYIALLVGPMWWLQRLPDLPPGSDFHLFVANIWRAIFYVINYHPWTPMALGHLWSLACEMQFYLVGPLLFLAGGQSKIRRTILFGLLLLALSALGVLEPLIAKRADHLGWAFNDGWKYHFEFAVWPMMAGFFCECRQEWFSRLPAAAVKAMLWLSLVLCGASFGLMMFGHEVKILVIATGALLLAPCLLAYLYGRPLSGWSGNCLRWLGERTYSIYLWQQPLTICGFLPNLWHPVGALIAIVMGAGSFRVFEFPFLSVNRQKQEKAR